MARITIDLTLRSTDGSIGGLRLFNIATGEGDKVAAWMPFGVWKWHPIGGGQEAIPEYWRRVRTGRWTWEVEDPSKVHLMLYIEGEHMGRMSYFGRDIFERGNRQLAGRWLFYYDDRKYEGMWELAGVGYDRS